MIAKLGLTAPQMRDIQIYRAIEPIGEAMADYGAGDGEPEKQEIDDATKQRLKQLAVTQRTQLAARKKDQ